MESGARRPRPTSTSVPTRFRTMWRRKPSPSTRIEISPRDSPVTSRRESVRTRGLDVGAGRLEGREVVAPPAGPGGLRHGLEVEGRGDPVAEARPQRRGVGAVPDAVAVELRAGVAAGVEVVRRSGGVDDRHVRGQHTVERPQQARGVEPGLDPHAGHLPPGVDAGVGSPGSGHPHAAPRHPRERVLQTPLDGAPAAGLDLPALERGPVVLEREAEGRHGAPRLSGPPAGPPRA